MSRRSAVIGGNWKMNTTLAEATELAAELTTRIGSVGHPDVVIFPPFPNLHAVDTVIRDTRLQLGAQDVFWAEKGAYTGEVSAAMLKSVGARWVIVGHSERRHIIGESDEVVNAKLRLALSTGLDVVLAVGETESQREANETQYVLASQLGRSLDGVDKPAGARLVIAYEPVWAIGTGRTATPEQAQAAHAFIRAWLGDRWSYEVAAGTSIQYGGSVSAANAFDLLAQPDIDGALVGGASLKAEEFASIVMAQRELLENDRSDTIGS